MATEFQLILFSFNFRNTSIKWLRSRLSLATFLPCVDSWPTAMLKQKRTWISSLQAKETRQPTLITFSTIIKVKFSRMYLEPASTILEVVHKTTLLTWWWMHRWWTQTCMRQTKEQKVSKMLLINLQVADKMSQAWEFKTCLNNTTMENQTKKQDKKELA